MAENGSFSIYTAWCDRDLTNLRCWRRARTAIKGSFPSDPNSSAISLDGYGNTIAAMAGSIAAIFFGKPEKTKKIGIEKANVIKYRPPQKVTRNHY